MMSIMPVLAFKDVFANRQIVHFECQFDQSNGENCIRVRQIHSSEKEVTSEEVGRHIRSLGQAKCAPKWLSDLVQVNGNQLPFSIRFASLFNTKML